MNFCRAALMLKDNISISFSSDSESLVPSLSLAELTDSLASGAELVTGANVCDWCCAND